MEEEERIFGNEHRGTSRRCRWLIATSIAIAFFIAALSMSISSHVVSIKAHGVDTRHVDLSIALSSKKKRSDKSIEYSTLDEGKQAASPETTWIDAAPSGSNPSSPSQTAPHLNSSGCFPHNSHRWLTSDRIRNTESADLSASFEILLPPAQESFFDSKPQYQNAMQETLCLAGSRFLATNWENETNVDDDKSVRIWTTRVVYLAITFHQHYLAWEEYDHRRNQLSEQCQRARENFHLSQNDFECPKAKFLVIPLGDNGLGANFKLGAMAAMKTALATGRVALYINHFNHTRHKWLQKPWTLASCPRRDYQCFFMPPSPCVLTHQEYQDAHLLNKTEMRMLFKQGNLPHLEDERVIVYSPTFRPQREPPLMRSRLRRIGTFLVQQGLLPDIEIVRRAIHRIAAPANERATAFIGDDELGGGLLLYVSRPLPEYLQKLQDIHQALVATNKLSSPSIGLPIRASDKCDVESECFDFETYVRAAHDWWLHKWPESTKKTKVPVVVTTESEAVLEQERAWSNRSSQAPWEHLRFDFIHNTFDVTQNTGLVRSVAENHTTADQVMLSSLSSLRAQLLNRVVLGNCCSNFHRLMQILVRNGCSSDWQSEFVCLQHHPNESFRLCCAWDKSETCRQKRSIG